MKTRVLILLSLFSVAQFAAAKELEQLDDDQLSAVVGQDGVNLNIKNFSITSGGGAGFPPLTLTYTMPYAGTNQTTDPGDPFFKDPIKQVSYIQYGNISISRSDPSDVFSDPYQIQIQTLAVPSQVQLASVAHPTDASLTLPAQLEVIGLLNPLNLAGDQKWQMQYDWTVVTGVISGVPPLTHQMGAYMLQDVKFFGGGLYLAPAWSYANSADVSGTAFGLDLNMQIGALLLRPRGASDTGSTRTELAMSGISVGRALYMDGGNSLSTGAPTAVVDSDPTHAWRVADVIQQPGIITAKTDASGNSTLQMGIEWYRGSATDPARPEAVGAISVNDVTIRNNSGVTDLGSMSIGAMKINYLNINFRN
ncbi:MAG: hypothetical protein KGN37_10040 [Burkholderiales bacterium]|nr:hypothetical protein [Burkholderiales bacterium]